MPYNLFLIPIITGYVILIYSKIFKYNSQRLDRGRVLFESVAIAVIIISSGFIFRTILQLIFPKLIPAILDILKVVPIQKPPYFWTYTFSSLITLTFMYIINKIIDKKYKKYEPIGWAVNKNGDELEKLFKKSTKEGLIIQVTLKNNKVYIGFSEFIPIPQKTNYLTLTPLISGYRDNATKQLKITTDYFKVVEEYMEGLDDNENSITLNTDVIIKQDEILTAGIYEQEIFDKFNKVIDY